MAQAVPTQPELPNGRALFEGTQQLTAHLRGRIESLPSVATRCQNCHGRHMGMSTLGPPLALRSLTGLQARRGGPPSAFDEESFCRLLRTGVDPMEVVVRSAMPVYRINDAQCKVLWRFLTQTEPQP